MAEFRKPKRLGMALIVSGPSGAGKSTICGLLRESEPGLQFSVSCTTRSPRPGEKHGTDYYFISKGEFEARLQGQEFLEHALVHGNYYGTLKSEVVQRVASGADVLLDIDVQGAKQINRQAKDDPVLSRCVESVFIGPPSFAELERRLRNRATETEEVIQRRLQNARDEMEHWREYGFLVINKEIDRTVCDMRNLVDILHKSSKRLEDSGFYG